ncbi:hypothetical protein [Sinorhizobium meliloti]|uniref:hypothetical protein n=1 Tax=Rhizobium meliloti TaxID=382 RepID=UPI000B49CB10|nr:hypothetical protein [Sinorhizobium meliloti]ASP68638.1 hypothetical protein CDO29_30015 [Sinorhizobium meliloti]MQX01394.1 hypothetical protein [Sinorhizobium meliloti]RVG05665.1 hypothetical protein CN234_24100 [Sinorhizobium meliloti]RVK44202.1 hypothetical protein CN160_27295 [Sinorhizobium meliloti]
MSFASKHFEFMQPVLTAHDLGLPKVEPGEIDGQLFDFRPGDRVLIFNEDRTSYTEARFKEWIRLTLESRKLAVFGRLESNEQITLSNAGMRWLEKFGRIVPVGTSGKRILPGSSHRLSDAVRQDAEKALVTVDRYYAWLESIGYEMYGLKQRTKEFLAAIAAERGEAPMSYEWLRKMVRNDEAGTHFDRLMNFARAPRRGNESPRLPGLIYEALELAAHFAWSQPKGDYKTMMDHFIHLLLEEDRFAPVRHVGLTKEGAIKLHKSTFDFHLAAVDKYTRSLLRHGADIAAARNRQYIRVHRPQNLLDIVDVDHLNPDIIAYLDENPLAFGRLDLVLFRERLSGSIIAYAAGFGDPSYATFLRGLEAAIFGMERLVEGVTWPWFGLFNKLAVDNALHLIGDSIDAAAHAIGFDIIEHRPAAPGDKGALERALGTLARDVFQNLPGTTMESPEIRKLFGEDRNMAVPVLALSEVEAVIQHWIANVHHQTPRQGLGGDLLTEAGVPAELWKKHEASIPRRPLLDRSIFARLAGETRWVTVQSDGVRSDGIHWNSPGLLALSLHPKTKRAKSGRDSTKFRMTINVNDIGQAWVHDPYREEIIEVRAVGPDAEYCSGMTMEIHKMIQDFRRKEEKAGRVKPHLLQARRELHSKLMDLIDQNRKRYAPRKKLAKFVQGHFVADRRRKVLEVARMEDDGTIDLSNGVEVTTALRTVPAPATDVTKTHVPAPAVEQKSEPRSAETRRKSAPKKTSPAGDDDDDIASLLARNPDWKKKP